MDGGGGEKPRRGAYRTETVIPRQTAHSKKKKIDSEIRLNSVDDLQARITPAEQSNTEDNFENNVSAEVSEQLDEEISLAVTPSCSCVELPDDVTEQATREGVVPSLLYEGASISTDTSHLLVNSYMCRHHLTGKAREDLLQLLHLFLPNKNNLPSSLYTLNKQADHTMDITPDFHYFCTHCHSILPDNKASMCPNQSCNMTLDNSKNFFITLSVAKQLKVLLKSKCVN